MLQALVHLLATRPRWLAAHAEAYAELGLAEAAEAATAWQRSLWLWAVMLCALAVSATLAGVALLLWAVMPAVPAATAWLLWATPLLPLVAVALAGAAHRHNRQAGRFACLREQWQADRSLLRELGTR